MKKYIIKIINKIIGRKDVYGDRQKNCNEYFMFLKK